MKFNGEYNEREQEALRIAVTAANEALAEAHHDGDPHLFHVSFIELGGAEGQAVDPFYVIGATHEAEHPSG